MNPNIRTLIFNGNSMKTGFYKGLTQLMRLDEDKFNQINLMASIPFSDSLEALIKHIKYNRRLTDLNLSANYFSLKATQLLSNYMINHGNNLRDLNLSACNISY